MGIKSNVFMEEVMNYMLGKVIKSIEYKYEKQLLL